VSNARQHVLHLTWLALLALCLGASTAGCRGPAEPATVTVEPTATSAPSCLPVADEDTTTVEGEVVDGPFTFRLRRLQDRQFQHAGTEFLYQFTDIPNIGWRYDWSFEGSESGSVQESWSVLINGALALDAPDGIADLRRVTQGNRAGGVLLPRVPIDGDRVGLRVMLAGLDRNYDAVVSFTLRQEAGVWKACDIAFSS
jgi:hypothetical protein